MNKNFGREKTETGRRGVQDGPLIVDPEATVLPEPRVRLDSEVIKEAQARIAARRKSFRLPTREELGIMALDVYRLALDHQRAYKDRHGNECSYPAPDFGAALNAARLVAELAGVAGKHSVAPTREQDDESIETAEKALDKLRSRIAVRKLGD